MSSLRWIDATWFLIVRFETQRRVAITFTSYPRYRAHKVCRSKLVKIAWDVASTDVPPFLIPCSTASGEGRRYRITADDAPLERAAATRDTPSVYYRGHQRDKSTSAYLPPQTKPGGEGRSLCWCD